MSRVIVEYCSPENWKRFGRLCKSTVPLTEPPKRRLQLLHEGCFGRAPRNGNVPGSYGKTYICTCNSTAGEQCQSGNLWCCCRCGCGMLPLVESCSGCVLPFNAWGHAEEEPSCMRCIEDFLSSCCAQSISNIHAQIEAPRVPSDTVYVVTLLRPITVPNEARSCSNDVYPNEG